MVIKIKSILAKKLKKKDGFAMLMFVLMLPIMIGFMGLAIDFGNFMYYHIKISYACRLAEITALSTLDDQFSNIEEIKQVAYDNFWVNMTGSRNKTLSNVRLINLNNSVQKINDNDIKIQLRAELEVEYYFLPIIGAPKKSTISVTSPGSLLNN